ncbi:MULTISPECIES: hypothetical protein [Xanthomonas]|uniref:hypothetical protein n=1 Tax=Xanthomonas TaxID=338 RepID=UPI00224E0F34|nr:MULTISPECIES: hypothetical protein [Xanthomonas]MDY4285042.1 hypothetical protein [Xanthomonas sp. LF06-19]
MYKIAQLILVLHIASRANRCSLTKLHLFNWAFKAPERGQRLSQAARSKSLNVPAWGFDPALAIALRYATAEGLVIAARSGYELSDMGKIFAKSIMEKPGVLESEKELLKEIGKNISESMVDEVAKGWDAK